MNIVSWNSRSLGHFWKMNNVKDLLKTEMSALLMFQETKLSEQDMFQNIQKTKNYEGISISATGTSIGISTWWDKASWVLISHTKCLHWLRTYLQNTTFGSNISLFNIYAPAHYKDREMLKFISGRPQLLSFSHDFRWGFEPDFARKWKEGWLLSCIPV